MNLLSNAYPLAVALSAVFAVQTAAAQAPSGSSAAVAASGTTRAQVTAEYFEARRLGLIPHGEAGVNAAPAFGRSRARADVQAEYNEARRAGMVPHGEFVPVPATVGRPLSRAQVLAELKMAQQLGLLPHGEAGPREPSTQEIEMVRRAGDRAAPGVVATR